jgi:predicted TIM-barrel fold metal-dependent hydrolase
MQRSRPDICDAMQGGPLGQLRRLYYDVVNATHSMAFNAVREMAGITQLLHGTDFPYWETGITAKGLAALGLPAAELAAVERENALRLMPSLQERMAG